MNLQKLFIAVSATLILTSSASAGIITILSPIFTKGFFVAGTTTPLPTLPADGTTYAALTFTITNPNTFTGLHSINFTDILPPGLQVAMPSGLTGTCGAGTITADAGSNVISLAGGSLTSTSANPAFPTCSFVVNVVGITPGVQLNTTSVLTSNDDRLNSAANAPAATASIIVLGPPTLTKAFSAPFIAVGNSTTLTLTLTNPGAADLTGVSFSDTLPGVRIAANPVQTSTCGGKLKAASGSNNITLLNATILANSSCTITVQVTGNTPGLFTNVTSTVRPANAPTGAPATAPIVVIPADAFEVRYASGLSFGDSVINFTNAGSAIPRPPALLADVDTAQPEIVALPPATDGNICVNAYAFSPDEQLISCCSCIVTPNALESLSARNDLISNTLTPSVPTSIVVKLIASGLTTVGTTQTCNAATVTPASIAFAGGLAAWGTSLHPAPLTPGTPAGTFALTETPFVRSTLSPAELARITGLCGFIQSNGSGFGICRSCRLGGLGGEKQ